MSDNTIPEYLQPALAQLEKARVSTPRLLAVFRHF